MIAARTNTDMLKGNGEKSRMLIDYGMKINHMHN